MKSSAGLSSTPPEVLESLSNLGARLRACRIERGFSLNDMASRMFCAINTYRALESGKPTSSVGSLCNALWLLGQLEGIDQLAPVSLALSRVRCGKRKSGRGKMSEYDLNF
jgi:transcriptional regulator with XRE-family HTH domain